MLYDWYWQCALWYLCIFRNIELPQILNNNLMKAFTMHLIFVVRYLAVRAELTEPLMSFHLVFELVRYCFLNNYGYVVWSVLPVELLLLRS